MHIGIAGNIGSGKTTLTSLLAKHYKWEPHYEDVDDNPYLNDFYQDMQRWSFNLQIYFLNSRFNQIIEIRNLISDLGKEKTVLLSTHILQEVAAICDRVIIINKGKIVADETMDKTSAEELETKFRELTTT